MLVSANAVQECAGWSIFVGCIAKLMKSSGLEVYVAAAYAGLTSIIGVTNFYRYFQLEVLGEGHSGFSCSSAGYAMESGR